MKRFKANQNNHLIIYIGIILISIAFSIKYLYKSKQVNDNTIIDVLINDLYGNYDKKIDDVGFLLKYALNIDLEEETIKPVIKEDNIQDELPLVYIYNTHDTEKYQSISNEKYNISSNVKLASKILKEYLEDLGIRTIAEDDSVQEKVNALNWKYGYSYKVSRMFMEEEKKKYPTLKYFIDLHRDSGSHDKTTTTINGKKYARLLFVIGLEHDNYDKNEKIALNLKNRLDDIDQTICRGIMKKSGPNVNGIYNQDFSSRTMLIEVGGQYNTIEEVNNSLELLAKVLFDYIKEDNI